MAQAFLGVVEPRIDEPTALHPGGDLALSPEALKELREDRDYIACHASVVRFILLPFRLHLSLGAKKHIDIRILENIISRIPLVFGLKPECEILMFMWSFGHL